MILDTKLLPLTWLHAEATVCLTKQPRAEELERSCEIKEEWRVGWRGPSAEDRTPPFNLCNLHDSEK
ncbi:hypothetical protein PAMA_008850 [Pampus argenteus]